MNKSSDNKKATQNKQTTQKSSTVVFHGVRFDVRAFEFKGKNGTHFRREAVIHPGAVVILPLLTSDSVVMIRNERFAVGETLWELPAGTMEYSEDPAQTAKRELEEETGYQAKKIEALLSFYTTPGICNEIMHAYVARDLSFVGQKLEESEKIAVEVIGWDQLMRMIRQGEIHDGKTLTTLLFYRELIQ